MKKTMLWIMVIVLLMPTFSSAGLRYEKCQYEHTWELIDEDDMGAYLRVFQVESCPNGAFPHYHERFVYGTTYTYQCVYCGETKQTYVETLEPEIRCHLVYTGSFEEPI